MPETATIDFFERLIHHIREQIQTPKVQVERAVGPILGMFIAEALSAKLDDDIEMISAEFPLRKAGPDAPELCQSTNIDWLLYSTKRDQLIFLELKTTDTTFDSEQAKIYLDIISRISSVGASFLLEDVNKIKSVSSEKGKYAAMLARLQRNPLYVNCKQAELVYLTPKVMKDAWESKSGGDVKWLHFEELAKDISSDFPAEWKTLRTFLIELDSITRQSRNGEVKAETGRNFAAICTFAEVIQRCEQHNDGITVGFYGGIVRLQATSLEELKARRYKWDYATNGTGTKYGRNWIPGSTFAQLVSEKNRSATASA